MFIHLGEDTIIRTSDVIAVFNYERMKENDDNQGLLSDLKNKKVMIQIGKQKTKSAVFTDDGVYLSPFSPATLKRRSQSTVPMA